jgi:C-terminal processing protease CtpA/Prc
LTVVLVLAACSAYETPTPTAPQPSPEFLALDTRGRNLAVYDALWTQIRSNYYDPDYFGTEDWRSHRSEWRERAANVGDQPLALYDEVLRPMLKLMRESHFQADYPAAAARSAMDPAIDRRKQDENRETMERLWPIFVAGPGVYSTDVRRGNRTFKLVSDVWPGTQAEERGIRPGWRVLSYDSSLSVQDNAVRFSGEFVPLDAIAARAWERGDLPDVVPLESNIVRVKFEQVSTRARAVVETRRLEGGVRYLRFDGFGGEAFMEPVFAALDQAGPEGLIIDLRWNVGGSVDLQRRFSAAVMGVDAHLGKSQDRNGTTSMRATRHHKLITSPLVVLVGPVTASGAEIFAAAVQDHERGRLVGRLTNGSVLTAQYFPLPDSGHVMVPISSFNRTDGRGIEGVGVEPDVWILPTLEDVRAGRDPVLDRALEELAHMRARIVAVN